MMAATTASSVSNPDVVDPLERIFQGLKSASVDARSHSAIELQLHMADATGQTVPRLLEKAFDMIFDLLQGKTSAEKLGGILAIDRMLEVERVIDDISTLFRMYNYVNFVLPDPDFDVMLAASKTLGQIVRICGPAFGDHFMDYAVQSALVLLQTDVQKPDRYAGVLILRELARNGPSFFHPHVDVVLDSIFVPLWDSRVVVRRSAAELLAVCLEIVNTQEGQSDNASLVKFMRGAELGLQAPENQVIHGSLLAYRELLLQDGAFLKEKSPDVGKRILTFETHEDSLIRETVSAITPTLAAYDTFIERQV